MRPTENRRQAAAEATQREIIEAASRLFGADGYHATSIARIAVEAGVAVQTIYNSIGSKRDVLSRVLDFAAAGDLAPVPVPQFMREQAELEPDPRRIIAQLVEFWRGAFPRTAPIFRIIREAAAADPVVAALEQARTAQRLRNYEEAARLIKGRGGLRDALTVKQAAATILAIGNSEIYRALVIDGDWDDLDWAEWVQSTLERTLLTGSRVDPTVARAT